MPVDFLQEQEGRDANGRFIKGYSGNPGGRPPGRRNKTTEAAELLLDGEVEALTRRAAELALDGQIGALRLCLDRIIPPRRQRATASGSKAVGTGCEGQIFTTTPLFGRLRRIGIAVRAPAPLC